MPDFDYEISIRNVPTAPHMPLESLQIVQKYKSFVRPYHDRFRKYLERLDELEGYRLCKRTKGTADQAIWSPQSPTDEELDRATATGYEEIAYHKRACQEYEEAQARYVELQRHIFYVLHLEDKEADWYEDAKELLVEALGGEPPDQNAYVIALDVDQKLIGVLCYGLCGLGGELPEWKFSLAVAHPFRRRGVATELTKLFLNLRQTIGVLAPVRVWVVNKDACIPLLEKLDFDFDGEHHCTLM